MPKKLRLDQLLVGKGLFSSREQARRAIMAGNVMIDTRIAANQQSFLMNERPSQCGRHGNTSAEVR